MHDHCFTYKDQFFFAILPVFGVITQTLPGPQLSAGPIST